MLEHSAQQKGLTLKLDIQGKLPQTVSGDPTRLRQVLVNLAGNAVKFTEHGSVTIAAKTVQQDENGVTIAFSVADTGIGIRDEDQARIFEPFEQADSSVTRKYGGTGLGLVIARRIVETASRGTHKLTLESREGLGSTFRFAMDFALAEPVLEPECERLPEMDEEKTVLLVDDSEINLVMECELLRSFGLQVDTAASAGDALRPAEQRVYDLVLLDIRMLDMDGYELAKRLRRLETYRAVPLLALTADAVGGVRERALDAGMNDCITKPVRPDRLYQVLRRYFALAVDAPETLVTDHGGLFRRERALATLGGDREQLAALCRRAIQTPVILVSSYGEFEYAREGLVLGAFDYIVKPFREEQLSAVLSRAAQSLSAHMDEDSQYALVRETFETLGIPVQEDGFVHTLAAF